jgi:hypothetical protein
MLSFSLIGFYQITLTTVGLGDFFPTTKASRGYSFVFIFIGLGLWGIVFGAASVFLKASY